MNSLLTKCCYVLQVKIWQLPSQADTNQFSALNPMATLSVDTKAVDTVTWHPTVLGLLVATANKRLSLLNIQTQQEVSCKYLDIWTFQFLQLYLTSGKQLTFSEYVKKVPVINLSTENITSRLAVWFCICLVQVMLLVLHVLKDDACNIVSYCSAFKPILKLKKEALYYEYI